ncbi:MAG: WG repeat-containing protein [Aureispira sp.]|nr:WG repeat-containing protein [Aureispira sp.]
MLKYITLSIVFILLYTSCTNTPPEEPTPVVRDYELNVYDNDSPTAEFVMYSGGKGQSRDRILEQFFHNRRLVRRFVDQDTLWGFIDTDSTLVIDCKYYKASTFEHGYAFVEKNGLKGIIHKDGKEVLAVKYDKLWARFKTPEKKEVLFMYLQDSSWGFASQDKGELCRLKVDSLFNFKYGFAVAKASDKMALTRYDGKHLTEFKYDWISTFSEGLVGVRIDEKCGFLNEQGEEVIPLVYDSYQGFFKGVGCVKKGDKWGIIDKNNNVLLPFKYDEVYDLWENGKFTIKNKNTKKCVTLDQIYSGKAQKILAMPYDKIDFFENGRALVTKNNKIGAIDTNGRVVIPLVYNSLYQDYETPFFIAKKGDKTGLLDSTGEVIFPFLYSYMDLHVVNNNTLKYLEVRNSRTTYGIVTPKNKIIIPLEYDWASVSKAGYAFVCKDDLWGFLSLDGTAKELIPIKYVELKENKQNPNIVYAYKDSLMQQIDTFHLSK